MRDDVCEPITVSIGFVLADPEEKDFYDIDTFVYAADWAMYEAKQGGKNCTVQFSKERYLSATQSPLANKEELASFAQLSKEENIQPM